MTKGPENKHLENDNEQTMSDDEVIARVCELLKVKFYSKDIPRIEGKEPESDASRFLVAILSSRDPIVVNTLRLLLDEMKKSPESDSVSRVESLIRMYRMLIKEEVDIVDKIVPLKNRYLDDKKRRKYASERDGKRFFHLRLNSIATITSIVLMLIVLTFFIKANNKAEYWEKQVEEIRENFAPFLETMNEEEPSKVAVKKEVNVSPKTLQTKPSEKKEVKEPKVPVIKQFNKLIVEKLKLPSAKDLMMIYRKSYNAKTGILDEVNQRKEVLKAILAIEGNREVFVESIRAVAEKEISEEKINVFVKATTEGLVLPIGSELFKIYLSKESVEKKQKLLLQKMFDLQENASLIEKQLKLLLKE